MNPLKTSAMFAAYVWFMSRKGEDATAEEAAASFSREHWEEFLPCAHEGLGRLLIRLARKPKKVRRRCKKLPDRRRMMAT